MATYYTFALKFDHHGSKMFKNQYKGGQKNIFDAQPH